MSGAPANKRSKFDHSKKPKFYKNAAKNFLEVGVRGFMATTNFREKECVRECYNILNSYADELYGIDQLDYAEDTPQKEEDVDANAVKNPEAEKAAAVKKSDDEEEEDIATTLENEIKSATAANAAGNKKRRFHQVTTGASNCVFIKTSLRDPLKLGVHIIRDVADNRKHITRNVLRFVPIEAVCKANVVDIKNAAGKLFDKYFLNAPPTTYSIVYNKRYNNDLNRDDIIRQLAELVDLKSREHKVDLKNGHYSVLVEIVKGLCCLSVLPDYMKLKKYNLAELMAGDGPPNKAKTDVAEKEEVAADIECTLSDDKE